MIQIKKLIGCGIFISNITGTYAQEVTIHNSTNATMNTLFIRWEGSDGDTHNISTGAKIYNSDVSSPALELENTVDSLAVNAPFILATLKPGQTAVFSYFNLPKNGYASISINGGFLRNEQSDYPVLLNNHTSDKTIFDIYKGTSTKWSAEAKCTETGAGAKSGCSSIMIPKTFSS